jgi:hypothetical protein
MIHICMNHHYDTYRIVQRCTIERTLLLLLLLLIKFKEKVEKYQSDHTRNECLLRFN